MSLPAPPDWTSVREARGHILSRIVPVAGTERVAVDEALWRVLAADMVAPFAVPGFDNSAMDGFLCHFSDVGGGDVVLPVVGAAFAGAPFEGGFDVGACIKVMTGARVAGGGDTVVPREMTVAQEDGRVLVRADARRRAGDHVRRAGEDLQEGGVALATGRCLRPADLGLLASIGQETVSVWRRPVVAFFSTGDEVRTQGERLRVGEVYDSNRHTLRAMIRRLGFGELDLGVVRDDRGALGEAFDRAAKEADVVVTSGGVSVGEADHVRAVLAERGEVLFWKVAMRPGRPLAYGKVGGTDFFGLPGNPVSVMVCFYQFVLPAVWLRGGCSAPPVAPTFYARTMTAIRKPLGRTDFQRGVLGVDERGEPCVTVTGDQGSGILSSMSRADAFIVLPDEIGKVSAGDWVCVQPFDGLV